MKDLMIMSQTIIQLTAVSLKKIQMGTFGNGNSVSEIGECSKYKSGFVNHYQIVEY